MATAKSKTPAQGKGATKKTTRKVVTTTSTVLELKGTKAEKAIGELVTLREAIRNLNAQKQEVEALIRETLGEAKVGTIDGVKRVEIKDSQATSFDRELLQSAYPEAFTKTLRVTPYTKIVTM
jgi:predicted phage-related endonuclease